MITCQECREQLYPHDPSKPFYVGHNSRFKGVVDGYLRSDCETCSNYPGIWGEPEIPTTGYIPIARLNREQSGALQQNHGEIFYLRNKLEEHLDRSKRKTKYV